MSALAVAATRPAALSDARLAAERGRLTAWLPVEAASVSGWLTAPDGRRYAVSLDATGAGRFEATLPDVPSGAAFADLAAPGVPVRAGLSIPWPAEYGESGRDENALRRLATLVGEDPAAPGAGTRDVSLWFAGLALLLFLADRFVSGLKRPGGKGR
jgi:hypothetical protein